MFECLHLEKKDDNIGNITLHNDLASSQLCNVMQGKYETTGGYHDFLLIYDIMSIV